MKSLGLFLLAAGFLVAALPAAAQGSTSFSLDGAAEGGQFFFRTTGGADKNPTLTVPSGQAVTVTLKNVGDQVHNFCFNTNDQCSEYVETDGQTTTYTFTATANGIYYCLPHKSSGMQGTVSIASATTTPPADGGNDSPGFGLVGVAVALAGAALLLARRK